MPDFLVQTASIVDFFYPFVTEDAVSAETQLAQIATENQGNARADADNEAELEAESELESELESDADAETLGPLSCGGDKKCVNDNLHGMTRVHIKDKLENDVTIEMPEAQKKKITFDSPTLTVVDKDFDDKPTAPIAPKAPTPPATVAPVKPDAKAPAPAPAAPKGPAPAPAAPKGPTPAPAAPKAAAPTPAPVKKALAPKPAPAAAAAPALKKVETPKPKATAVQKNLESDGEDDSEDDDDEDVGATTVVGAKQLNKSKMVAGPPAGAALGKPAGMA